MIATWKAARRKGEGKGRGPRTAHPARESRWVKSSIYQRRKGRGKRFRETSPLIEKDLQKNEMEAGSFCLLFEGEMRSVVLEANIA